MSPCTIGDLSACSWITSVFLMSILLEQVNGIHWCLKVLGINFKKAHVEMVFNKLADKFPNSSWWSVEGDFQVILYEIYFWRVECRSDDFDSCFKIRRPTQRSLSSLKHIRRSICMLSTYPYSILCILHIYIYLLENGGLSWMCMVLFYVDLFKIIRNYHILVRFSEAKCHYILRLYTQKFSSYSRPPESIRQCSFSSFIWALTIPSRPTSWWWGGHDRMLMCKRH